MMRHKALHPRDDIDRLYVSRKEGGRGLIGIEDSVNESIREPKEDTKKSQNGRIRVTSKRTDNIKTKRKTTKLRNRNRKKKKTFEATNRRNLTRDDQDKTNKERN